MLKIHREQENKYRVYTQNYRKEIVPSMDLYGPMGLQMYLERLDLERDHIRGMTRVFELEKPKFTKAYYIEKNKKYELFYME